MSDGRQSSGVVTVAGHICLDVIPHFAGPARLAPGTLNEVGPAHFATGGAVANVGLALERLGVQVRLIGRIADDPFGSILESLLDGGATASRHDLDRVPGESTSYSVVVSPPGIDRMFLHHPGCNDGFDPKQVDRTSLRGSRILYFGYPPAMRATYEDGGTALAELFADAKAAGLLTLLDMAMPDSLGASGRIDWERYLAHVLPHVDIFMPSLEETCFMLQRPSTNGSEDRWRLLQQLSDRLLELGTAVAVIKLGEEGLYLRSAAEPTGGRLPHTEPSTRHSGMAAPPNGRTLGPALIGRQWISRTVWTPAFEAEVVGTTGAGDAAIAGFIAGLLADLDPEECLAMAAAVGASSVEAPDANSGVRSWNDTRTRMAKGWPRRQQAAPAAGWRLHETSGSYLGPGDAA